LNPTPSSASVTLERKRRSDLGFLDWQGVLKAAEEGGAKIAEH
jgi:hypothetical protein